MSEITCSRCGNSRDAMEKPPFRGAVGARIAEHVCPPCWGEWANNEIMLINENQLSLGNAEHRQFLYQQMEQFFTLPPVQA